MPYWTLLRSPVWSNAKVLWLSFNMRLSNPKLLLKTKSKVVMLHLGVGCCWWRPRKGWEEKGIVRWRKTGYTCHIICSWMLIDEENNLMSNKVPGCARENFSFDTVANLCERPSDFDMLYPPEFLNKIVINNFLQHYQPLKIVLVSHFFF